MKFIFWNDSYKTGIEQIDDQHKILFGRYNDLIRAFAENDEVTRKMVVETTLAELFSYTKYHFFSEEMVLEKAGYQQCEEHKREHEFLREQLALFHKKHVIEGLPVQAELITFIEKWIVNHILKSDMAYVPHVTKNLPPRKD